MKLIRSEVRYKSKDLVIIEKPAFSRTVLVHQAGHDDKKSYFLKFPRCVYIVNIIGFPGFRFVARFHFAFIKQRLSSVHDEIWAAPFRTNGSSLDCSICLGKSVSGFTSLRTAYKSIDKMWNTYWEFAPCTSWINLSKKKDVNSVEFQDYLFTKPSPETGYRRLYLRNLTGDLNLLT